MRKVGVVKKQVSVKKWVKPVVKSEKLSTRSLFEGGGWFKSSNRLNTVAVAITAI